MIRKLALAVCCAGAVAWAAGTQPALSYLSNFCIVQAMATDPAGNIYVAGQTLSNAFPTVGPIQGPSGVYPDVIVAKLDSSGTQILYATYLGGNWGSVANGIAVDAEGYAYVTGWTEAGNFPVTGTAARSGNNLNSDAFALKISPDGSKLIYSHLLGGPTSFSQANAIAVDSSGNAYIAGVNTGSDFPTLNALQPAVRTNSLFVTANSGATFTSLTFPAGVAETYGLALDPEQLSTVFAATAGGLFKSTDAGATWRLVYTPPPLPEPGAGGPAMTAVVVDPRNSSNIYAAGATWGIVKSTDGGETFSQINNGIASIYLGYPFALNIDPANSSVLWATSADGVFRTANGGQSWQMEVDARTLGAEFPLALSDAVRILTSPANPSLVYVCCVNRTPDGQPVAGLLASADNGQTWSFNPGPGEYAFSQQAAIDPLNASVMYVAAYSNILRSADGGQTWTALTLPASFGNEYSDIQVDAHENVYVLTAGGEILRSGDAGQTWTAVSQGPWVGTETTGIFLGFNPGNPSIFYVSAYGSLQDAFVTKLNPNGDTLWSTLLGGTGTDTAQAIAVDGSGNVYVGGSTNSPDFPTVHPVQTRQGGEDAFISKISSDGTTLVYSTYLGGTGDDAVAGLGVDPAGAAYVAGNTTSYTNSGFPTVNALQSSPADIFLAKLAPAGDSLVYCTYLGTADSVNAVAVDSQGGLYFSGASRNDDFPLVDAFNTTGPAGYVAKLDPSGLSLDFSSYLIETPTYLIETQNPALALALAPSGSLWFGGRFVVPSTAPVGTDFGAAPEGFVGRIDFLPPVVSGVPQVRSVTDAASFRDGDVFAPGSIVSIFGSNLAEGTGQASGAPLPASLQSTIVLVGGVMAPLFYVSAGQINVQIPVELPAGATSLVVEHDGQASAAWPIGIVAAMPAIFTQTATGSGAGTIVHASDFSLVTPANPASNGEYLALFCTGLGATQPAVASGLAASGPAKATASSVTLSTAFGDTLPVQYAGLAPGWPGLYQVNFQWNAGLFYASTTLVLTVGNNFQSNPVTVYLRSTGVQ